MPGSRDLFDGQDLTNQITESSARTAGVDTLQIHHTTTTSYAGARALMDPGGREVSANGLMSNIGILMEVVLLARRAFTSASPYDNRCLTVEVCNTSLAPSWGISEASRERLAQLAVAMFRAGLLGSLTRAHIIGHNEVPGSYITECPGPDMHLDWIASRAQEIFEKGLNDMATGNFPRNSKTGTIYWEREPGAPLYQVSAAEWAQLKGTYVDFVPAVMDAWIAKVGLVTNPALAVAPKASIGNVSIPGVEKLLEAVTAQTLVMTKLADHLGV